MLSVTVDIVRFVDRDQPGWVECVLHDARGVAWTFVEKVPIVTAEYLDESSAYPCHGTIACEVVPNPDGVESPMVRIDMSRPWGVESIDGTSTFTVRREQLVDA
jgi:hypothetical protein